MNVSKLVRMVNQIAQNFDVGERDKAVAAIADHLTRYWTVEMKKGIVAHLNQGTTGLSELAEAAIVELSKNEAYAA